MKSIKISFALLLVLMVSCILVLGLADNMSGSYSYEILPDGTAKITRYRGYDNIITIPETLDGKKVTAVGNNVFMYADIEEIIIGENVLTIGSNAFFGCKAKRVTITTPTISIGEKAFSCCNNIENFLLCTNSVDIGNYAFMYTEPLANFEWKLFNSDATDVRVNIGECGFFSSGLVELTIPAKTLNIGKKAFSCSDTLKSISSNCLQVNIDDEAFMYCSSLETFSCPLAKKGSGKIGKYAFFSCGLIEIEIPSCINNIEEKAFSCSSSIADIIIPSSVKTIAKDAFLLCDRSMVAHVVEGTAAEKFCKMNNIIFEYVDASAKVSTTLITAVPKVVASTVEPTATPTAVPAPTAGPTATPVKTDMETQNVNQDKVTEEVILPKEAFADFLSIDLSGLSLDELHDLQARVADEIALRNMENGIPVPAGLYIVGKDIPAGGYLFKVNKNVDRKAQVRLFIDEATYSIAKEEGTIGAVSKNSIWWEYVEPGNEVYLSLAEGNIVNTRDAEFTASAFVVDSIAYNGIFYVGIDIPSGAYTISAPTQNSEKMQIRLYESKEAFDIAKADGTIGGLRKNTVLWEYLDPGEKVFASMKDNYILVIQGVDIVNLISNNELFN